MYRVIINDVTRKQDMYSTLSLKKESMLDIKKREKMAYVLYSKSMKSVIVHILTSKFIHNVIHY